MHPLQSNAQGPVVIGATGGSGTRLIAKLLIESGNVYLGQNHNAALDCLDFKQFYDKWVAPYSKHLLHQQQTGQLVAQMHFELDRVMDKYNLGKTVSANAEALWGWKGPRSMFLLPFFSDYFFGQLKFIHIIRDGRDMAFSSNQNQATLYADAILGPTEDKKDIACVLFKLWSKVNRFVAEFGRTTLADKYLIMRYEDLVNRPHESLTRLANFLDIDAADLHKNARWIKTNPTIGRWADQDNDQLLPLIQEDASLRYFGYI